MILNREYEAACTTLTARLPGDMPDQRCVTLATALYGQGKQEEALQKLNQACKINPANVTALKNRATVKGGILLLALLPQTHNQGPAAHLGCCPSSLA